MLFAFALLLHLGPVVNALPAAAVPTSAAAKPAPAPTAEFPEAPLPSRSSATSTQPQSHASSIEAHSQHELPPMHTASSVNPKVTQSLSDIRVPEIQEQKLNFSGVENPSSRDKWLALSIFSSGAAAFDAYSTRRALEGGAREEDPVMRPFASSPALYGVMQVCPVLLDFAARRMQRSEYSVLRHSWWLPQTVGAGIYLFSGAHNMTLPSHR